MQNATFSYFIVLSWITYIFRLILSIHFLRRMKNEVIIWYK